jgi:hypothetical protein
VIVVALTDATLSLWFSLRPARKIVFIDENAGESIEAEMGCECRARYSFPKRGAEQFSG